MSYKAERDTFQQQGFVQGSPQGGFSQVAPQGGFSQVAPQFPHAAPQSSLSQAGPQGGFSQGGFPQDSRQGGFQQTALQQTSFQQSSAQQGALAFQTQQPHNPIADVFDGQPIPGTSGKHPVAEAVGTALTGGRANAGTKGYLAVYLKQLEENPLRTKMLTAGSLAGLQELFASWLAKDRNKHGNYFTSRVPKMAAYGALVSAPLGHFLIWCLQKIFHGKTSLRAKIMQILVSNVIIAPIQNTVYLTAMALIAGARTYHQVRATVRVGFWKVMRVSWITSPLCLAFAQKFLPENAWVPFFNLVSFIIGTYINTVTKKRRLAALRKKHFGDGPARGGSVAGRGEDYPPPPTLGGQSSY